MQVILVFPSVFSMDALCLAAWIHRSRCGHTVEWRSPPSTATHRRSTGWTSTCPPKAQVCGKQASRFLSVYSCELILNHLILYFQHYNWYHKKVCLIWVMVRILQFISVAQQGITLGFHPQTTLNNRQHKTSLDSRSKPVVVYLPWFHNHYKCGINLKTNKHPGFQMISNMIIKMWW